MSEKPTQSEKKRKRKASQIVIASTKPTKGSLQKLENSSDSGTRPFENESKNNSKDEGSTKRKERLPGIYEDQLDDMFKVDCEMKCDIFSHADNMWRGWKSRLNTFDIQPFRHTNPEALKNVPKQANDSVSPEEWAEFLEWVTSPEFDIISENMS
ncbi:hypothetical protein ACFE04_028139 [Oxalis oulophora]